MRKYVSRFHYLTQDLPNKSHAMQVITACESGANWIQYRCLTKPEDELIDEINEVAAICDEWGVTLIVTNHYDLLERVDAQGVHMEDFDADLKTIRKVIGPDKTLGASAVDVNWLLYLQKLGIVDYCGFGPFAHTETKPNNYKLLGFEGYRELKNQDITIPVIAVGGIQLNDVELLMETGVYGIAVSGAINKAINPGQMLKAFYQKLH